MSDGGRSRALLAGAITALVAVSISACGGGASTHTATSTQSAKVTTAASTGPAESQSVGSGPVVAEVAGVQITRGQVSQWMATIAGGSYYELSGKHTIVDGLVSDPPNYPRCVAKLEAVAAVAPSKLYTVPTTHLLKKCREMYLALRYSATELLVEVQFEIALAQLFGIHVTDAEVLAAFEKSNALIYPTPAALRASQEARRVTTSEELLLMKKDVLSQKILAKLRAEGDKPELLLHAQAIVIAKTDCKPGYVVEHCRQYRNQPPPASGGVLMEQVAAIATGRCTNLPACGKP